MRLFTATLATETNTFSPLPTSIEETRMAPPSKVSVSATVRWAGCPGAGIGRPAPALAMAPRGP